jgi:transketolase
MRNAFAAELTALAQEEPRLVFLSGDIGNKLFDKYKAVAADRFINCGIAEANMIGMAAGMAMAGLRPIAYTITPFITTRCLEQIRVDVCYHNVPVVIVGVGSGLSYASLGATHQSCEDMAFLRALPHMNVIAPADANEVRGALRMAMSLDTPTYIRIGKKGEPLVHDSPPHMSPGAALVMREGRDVCLLSVGVMLPTVLAAAEELERAGISTEVVSFYSVKPLNETLLHKAFDRFKAVVTIEEHGLIGGAGAAVAEWLADQPPRNARLGRIGTKDVFMHENAHTAAARRFYGIDAPAIVAKVRELVAG